MEKKNSTVDFKNLETLIDLFDDNFPTALCFLCFILITFELCIESKDEQQEEVPFNCVIINRETLGIT